MPKSASASVIVSFRCESGSEKRTPRDGEERPYLVTKNRDANVPFFIDPRVIDLRREFHLCVVVEGSIRRRATETKIGMSMMSHRSLRGGCADRAWNFYRRCFEWEVLGQIEAEVKRSSFVRTVGLAIVPVNKRRDIV